MHREEGSACILTLRTCCVFISAVFMYVPLTSLFVFGVRVACNFLKLLSLSMIVECAMNILLLVIGLLLLTGGLIRVSSPYKFTRLRIRLIESAGYLAFANWLKRNEKFVRPVGVAMVLIGLLCVYFSL